jgi:inhibitor of cysteine peptidase
MNKKIFFFVFFLFSCFATILFAGNSSEAKPLNQDEASTAIETNSGNAIILTLDSNPTTGYGWQLGQPLSSGVLVFVSSEYLPSPTDLVGAPGKEIWTFKAVKAGKAVIVLNYVRSWEKDVAPADQKFFTITIKP